MSRIAEGITLFAAVLGLQIPAACNDKQAFQDEDRRIAAALTPHCRPGRVIQDDDGRWLCLYLNHDGQAITRPAFGQPLGAL